MGLLALAKRFTALHPDERGYYLRRFVDLQLHRRSGFSQYGEDASVAAYLKTIGRACRRYIDIGANHPVLHSNSYLFYRDGARGLLVEANPALAARLRRARPRDVVINKGVVPEGEGELDLQLMDMDGLSTFSTEWSDRAQLAGLATPQQTVSVPIVGINELLREHGPTECDFASIDIEGFDVPVLSAWDFDRWRPFLFCVETTKADQGVHSKDESLCDLLASRGYQPLFETYANTIFVDRR